ncbi:hypothetical protein ACLBR5_00440 [Escherichia coli]
MIAIILGVLFENQNIALFSWWGWRLPSRRGNFPIIRFLCTGRN